MIYPGHKTRTPLFPLELIPYLPCKRNLGSQLGQQQVGHQENSQMMMKSKEKMN